MSSYYRRTNITTKNNLSFLANNIDLISQEDDQKYNGLLVGQPVVYNPITGKTLNAAGIATAEAVKLGVGHGKGILADSIRWVGGEDIDLCQSRMKIGINPPTCPTPQVLDFEADCMISGRDYLFVLGIDDHWTRSFLKEGRVAELMINLREDLTGCNNCSQEQYTDQLMTQLALKINGKYLDYFPKTNKLGLNTGMPGYGVWAAKKYGTSVTFTLADSDVEDSCGAGCAVKGLKGMTADDMTALVFTNVVDPSNPTQTLMEQLATVISQINKWLKGKGSAYLKKVDCCSYEIEVNTCLAGVAMTYHDDAVVTSATADSFIESTEEDMYAGCEGPVGKTYAHGIRIFVDPLELPCNCQYPDGNPPSDFGRSVTITAWGDGWNDTSWQVVDKEPMGIIYGSGYEVQQNELRDSTGGEGRDYDVSLDYGPEGSRAPMPGAHTRLGQAVTADCNKMYCIWSLMVENHRAGSSISRNVHNSQSQSWINVPREDVDTISEMEEVLTALADRGFCSSATIECIPASS